MKKCKLKRCNNLIEDAEIRCNRCNNSKERVRINRIKLFERDPSRRDQYNAAAAIRKREQRRLQPKIDKIKLAKPVYRPKAKEPVIGDELILQEGYSITDIPDNGCKYPISKDAVRKNMHRFCGKQVEKLPWCEEHRKNLHSQGGKAQ